MVDGYLLNMRAPDDAGDGEGRALGPLKGAAGILAAWRKYDGMRAGPVAGARRALRDDVIDECMGTVRAIADLLAAVGATQGEVDAATRRMDGWDGYRGGHWEMEGRMTVESHGDTAQPRGGD